ncbi:MAG: InlB B-repeat-containing protein [Lachnospiraceae bacterium]
MKHDEEYNIGKEFEALPDEYLQGGGNKEDSLTNQRKQTWKKMMYFTAVLAIIAYMAAGTTSFDTTGFSGTGKQTQLPVYPVEDGTSYYVVYNDTCDPDNGWSNRILDSGFLFESQLLQGINYELPEYEPAEGYVFLGWVLFYGDGNMGMAGDALTASNICYIKPENGSRSIEVHAAWRHDGIGKWASLLTLDANGGIIESGSTVTYDASGPMASGSNVYLCAYPVPVRKGYTFAGWYTEPDCSGKPIKMLSGLDFYQKNGDGYDWSTMNPITLYAGWEKN